LPVADSVLQTVVRLGTPPSIPGFQVVIRDKELDPLFVV